MKELTVITGGGTGIGRALALELSGEHNQHVLIIGRRKEPVEETAGINTEKISICAADISRKEGRNKVLTSGCQC